MGFDAASTASGTFALGTAGAGYGATTYDLKGGLGSASAETSAGFRVGALVVVNSVGRATRGAAQKCRLAPRVARPAALTATSAPTRKPREVPALAEPSPPLRS